MLVKVIKNVLLLFLVFWMLGCSGKQNAESKTAVSLFDGKSFAGWEGDFNWFRIENGCIVAGSLEKEIPYNMFLCTIKEYGDFELKLEAKLVGPGDNSGIQFRCRRVPGTPEVGGYQADKGSPTGDFGVVWGGLYDEARRNRMLVTANQEEIKKVYRINDWNTMIVKCQNNHIQVWVNGYQSVDYTEDDITIARKGIIGFQIYAGAPTEVWFKNITLTEL